MAVTLLRTDGRMPQTAALDPALLMYIYIRYVCTHAYVYTCYPNVPIDRCVTPSAHHSLVCRVTKRPVTDLTGKTQAVLPPSTVKRFLQLEANKLPHKEGHAALPLTCPLCERETSQTVFINKTTGGLVCPSCKVDGELVRCSAVLTGLYREVAALQRYLDRCSAVLTGLYSEVAALQRYLDRCSTVLTGLYREVAALQRYLDRCSTVLTGLYREVAALQRYLDRCSAVLTDLYREVAALQRYLDSCSAVLTGLYREVAALQIPRPL